MQYTVAVVAAQYDPPDVRIIYNEKRLPNVARRAGYFAALTRALFK